MNYKITKNIQVSFELGNVNIVFELVNVNTVKFQSVKHSSALVNRYQLAVESEEKLQMWSCQRLVEVESATLMQQGPVGVGPARTS